MPIDPANPPDQITNPNAAIPVYVVSGGGGGGSPGGSTGAVQYNNANSFAGNANYTTDGNGNVTMTGSGGTNGSLTIVNQGIDSGQTPALTLIDNGGGSDGVSEVFKVLDGVTTLNEISININPTNFYTQDVTNSTNILDYQYATSLSVGNVSTPLLLTGLNTTLVESVGNVALTLGNPDQVTTQNSILYVNGQNAAIWSQGQNARIYANDGAGVNFIEAGVGGLVVGLVAYTDAKGKGTVNAESYYVNGVPFAAAIVSVSSLPGLAAGSRAFVNDSTVPAVGSFGIPVAGNGAYTVPVWCDGAVWYIG
jgi:hypothetical protein